MSGRGINYYSVYYVADNDQTEIIIIVALMTISCPFQWCAINNCLYVYVLVDRCLLR